MKLAVLIVFVVLAQCLTADAWNWVSCGTYNHHRSYTSSERSAIWSRVRHFQGRIRYFDGYLQQVATMKRNVPVIKSIVSSCKGTVSQVESTIASQATQLSAYDGLHPCSYRDDIMLCLVEEIIANEA